MFILNTLCFPAYADYSCLNKKEKEKIIKAFEQSRFYKYYETLVKGKDDIDILEVKLIKEENLPEAKVRKIYGITLNLVIADQKFKRSTEFEITSEIISQDESGFWDTALKIGLGVLVGILLGFVAGKQ